MSVQFRITHGGFEQVVGYDYFAARIALILTEYDIFCGREPAEQKIEVRAYGEWMPTNDEHFAGLRELLRA